MTKLEHYREVMRRISIGDVTSVLPQFTDDISLYPAIGLVGALEGKQAIEQWLHSIVATHLNTQLKIFHSAETDSTLFVEGVDEFDSPDGQHVILPYAGVYEFRGDKICGWRDYLHGPLLKKALAGEAPKDHILKLNDRPTI